MSLIFFNNSQAFASGLLKLTNLEEMCYVMKTSHVTHDIVTKSFNKHFKLHSGLQCLSGYKHEQ